MDAPDEFPRRENEPEVVLIAINEEKFYMIEGEQFLDELLLADGVNYPKPVRCLHFDSQFAFSTFLGENVNFSELWSVHPQVVVRLRKTGNLVDLKSASE